MKAKEYADKYINEGKTHKSLVDINRMFQQETHEIVRSRGVKTDVQLFAIFKEMDLKYQSFAKAVGVNIYGYRLVTDALHDTAAKECWPNFNFPERK